MKKPNLKKPGLKVEHDTIRSLRQRWGCQVISDWVLDHRLKTDFQIVGMDGQDVSPVVCVQITTSVGNKAKIRDFLKRTSGKYCRFLYVEITGPKEEGSFAPIIPSIHLLAKTIKEIVKKLLQAEWSRDRGAKNPTFGAIINCGEQSGRPSASYYAHQIKKLA